MVTVADLPALFSRSEAYGRPERNHVCLESHVQYPAKESVPRQIDGDTASHAAVCIFDEDRPSPYVYPDSRRGIQPYTLEDGVVCAAELHVDERRYPVAQRTVSYICVERYIRESFAVIPEPYPGSGPREKPLAENISVRGRQCRLEEAPPTPPPRLSSTFPL